MASKINLIRNPSFEQYKTHGSFWQRDVTSPNVAQASYVTLAQTGCYAGQLTKYVAGDCQLYQTIDLKYNAQGEIFQLGAWISVSDYNPASAIEFSYFWYDANDVQIGDQHIIVSITSGSLWWTLYNDDSIVAPSNAQKIKVFFQITGLGLTNALIDSFYLYGPKDYGLKVQDTSGNSGLILSNISSIISAGTITMPDTLNDDDSYGVDIDLPGTTPISIEDIGVMVTIRDFDYIVTNYTLAYDSGNHFWMCFYGDDSKTYYEKDTSNPDIAPPMIPWTAGNMTYGSPTTWNPILSIGIIAGWDRWEDFVTSVRLFAGVFYEFSTYISTDTVCSIGSNGISEIDYVIYLKNYDGS